VEVILNKQVSNCRRKEGRKEGRKEERKEKAHEEISYR